MVDPFGNAPVRATLRTSTVLYELEGLETCIGRAPENDLVIESHGVSRFQAKISFQGDLGPCITDVGSRHGTLVNSLRLHPQVSRGLQHRDVIQFSAHDKTTYLFELPESPDSHGVAFAACAPSVAPLGLDAESNTSPRTVAQNFPAPVECEERDGRCHGEVQENWSQSESSALPGHENAVTAQIVHANKVSQRVEESYPYPATEQPPSAPAFDVSTPVESQPEQGKIQEGTSRDTARLGVSEMRPGSAPDLRHEVQRSADDLDVVTELRRHLSLYERTIGPKALERDQSAATDESLRSLSCCLESGCQDTSVVLSALLTAERRVAEFEQEFVEAGARRWRALDADLESLRDEDVRQRQRGHTLRQEHLDFVRAVEQRIGSLRDKVSKATAGSDDPQMSTGLLVEEVRSLQEERVRLQAELEASSQLASRMRGHLEESSVRANSYRQLYADAEEAADRVEEARHGGVQSRIASLTRANATLQLQLQSAECRRRNIEEELER